MPLSNNDNIPVGMIFVGKTRLSVIAKAGDYLSYTFIITALMIVMSTIPSYYLARHFAFQLR